MKNITFKIFYSAAIMLSLSCSNEEKTDVTLSTFNIRYDNPADSLNNWKYRKDNVAEFVKTNSIDVVGMQEVLYNQLCDLQERLPQYDYVGVGREDGNTKGEYAPIFYRKDKYKLVSGDTFWLSQYPDSIGFIGWDGACTRIATWAKLEDKKTGKQFLAVNTHFDHVGLEARRNAANLIIDRIKEIANDCPTILTGDFNVSEDSEAYRTITGNEFTLHDAHKIAETTKGVNYTFHDFGRVQPIDQREKIDFIFVTPQIKVISSNIPENNNNYISDHNPQISEIRF